MKPPQPTLPKEIAYKNNLPFITSANSWLDRITEASVKMIENPKKYLDQYFSLISAFYRKHYAHISKIRKIGTRLKTIRKALYNPKFRSDWKEGDNPESVNLNLFKIIDAIDNILTEMTEDLSKSGITPDMIEKEVDKNTIKDKK